MNRKQFILLLFICFLCTFIADAQRDIEHSPDNSRFYTLDRSLFECLYEYHIHTKDKANQPVTETYNTILQVGNRVVKFWDYTAYEADSISFLAKEVSDELKKEYLNKMRRAVYYFDPVVFQNYPADKITVTDVIVPNNYIYTQKSNEFNWQLSDDTLSVCGYLCHKATASYGGREWTMWYTQDIPSSAGPWKFFGLPGLILQAEDSGGIHQFKAISIRKESLPIYMEKNAQRIEVAREKFLRNKIEFEKNPMSNIPVESVSNMSVVRFGDGPNDKIAYINGVQLRMRPNGYVPLELK